MLRRDESVVGWVPLEGSGLSVLGIRKLELEESRASGETTVEPAAPVVTPTFIGTPRELFVIEARRLSDNQVICIL